MTLKIVFLSLFYKKNFRYKVFEHAELISTVSFHPKSSVYMGVMALKIVFQSLF